MSAETRERVTASVVVPAHDEEDVVLRCLHALLDGARPGEFEVVVAANGCTDATVATVRTSGLPVRCLDLPDPGKIGALNAADAVCTVFPRIYLDADVLLGAQAARDLAGALLGPAPAVGAPEMVVDTSRSSALVRAYYRVWSSLPVFGPGYVGSGVYAVNEAGHARIAPLPAVTNDDDFVRRSFALGERVRSPGTFLVHPARSVAALVRRGERTRAGNAEVSRTVVTQFPPEPGGGSAGVLGALREPRRWPDVVIFCAITARVRWGAARRIRRGETGWGRDDSSRSGSAAPGSGSAPGRPPVR